MIAVLVPLLHGGGPTDPNNYSGQSLGDTKMSTSVIGDWLIVGTTFRHRLLIAHIVHTILGYIPFTPTETLYGYWQSSRSR